MVAQSCDSNRPHHKRLSLSLGWHGSFEDRSMRYHSPRSQARLTDAQQQRIARHYYALQTAVSTDPVSSRVEALHRQLQDTYRPIHFARWASCRPPRRNAGNG